MGRYNTFMTVQHVLQHYFYFEYFTNREITTTDIMSYWKLCGEQGSNCEYKDWNRIARLHSHVLAHMISLTASRCHIKVSMLFVRSYEPARGCVAVRCGSSSSEVRASDQITEGRGFKSHLGLGFFPSLRTSYNFIISINTLLL